MRRAILGALTTLSADQLTDLGLHQLLRDRPDGLANDVCVLIAQHLPDDLSDRHPVHSGHRRPPYPSNLEKSDDDERRGGRNYVPSDAVLHHATGRDPARPASPDHAYYVQLKERLGANRAALTIARKLLRRAHHTLRELGDDAMAPAR